MLTDDMIAAIHPCPDKGAGCWETLGWAVSNAEDSCLNDDGLRPYQLQRRDENPLFSSDAAAHLHVVQRAGKGDAEALAALAFLRAYSRPEYDDVMKTAGISVDPR